MQIDRKILVERRGFFNYIRLRRVIYASHVNISLLLFKSEAIC